MLKVLLVKKVEEVEHAENLANQNLFDSFNEGIIGNIAEFISNISTLLPIVIFLLLIIVFISTFKKRTKKISQALVESLSKNGKYIRGLFVELNDTKELTRYFLYGHKWKGRIIREYNILFDDENGRRLKKIFKKEDITFRLNRMMSINTIYNSINKTIDLMNNIRKSDFNISEEYQKTVMLFAVYNYRYIEKLEKLKIRTEFIKNRYIILTGSAGNGKTNLLCSLAELIIDNGKLCIFINSKDVCKDINLYIAEKLKLFNIKYFKCHWFIQNVLCFLCNRKIYIVIDAINENESKEFVESISKFIDSMMKYRNVKIIISCRSEYFDLKYKEILVNKVDKEPFYYDILTEKYTHVAKERMYEIYKEKFKYFGHVSLEVKEKLFKQLLLMRMFFEVNRNSEATFNTLNKYKIFQKYIDSVMGDKREECDMFLSTVVRKMCESENYSAIKISDIVNEFEISKAIRDFMDETILLSRKLILNPNTLIEKYDEEIYFVFDEMRDYCIARYVVGTLCVENGKPVKKEIIKFMDKLVQLKSVCTEGVINYIYSYYKGCGDINMCKTIMHKYMQPHDNALDEYRMHRERGINSWGLKVIFEDNLELYEYEKEYIRFIIEENPGKELASMFVYLVHQEEICGKYNLDLFLEGIYNIHDINKFCDVLKGTVTSWYNDGISKDDFIEIDKILERKNPKGCKRFRYYLILFVVFFDWNDRNKLQQYIERVCDAEKIKQELRGLIYFKEEGGKDESKI